MQWEVLIVPLIALGVWILSTLFKGEEDERVRQRRPGFDGAPGVPRRPVTDLDRFLEEARRRRETGERPREAAPRPAPPQSQPRVSRPALPSASSPPRATPPRRPARSAPSSAPRRRAPDPAELIPLTRPEVIPPQEVVIPLAAQAEPKIVRVEPVAPQTVPAQPQTPSGSAVTRPTVVLSPIVAQVRSLLRTPQSAAAAFVLREIFAQPICKRR
jgi:hypothetical protein